MRILAIETSMGRTSVALTSAAGEPMHVRSLEAGQPQAEGLIPLIADLMAEAAISFSSLGRIAVCIGPGGFSGIRTGVAAARAIGLAAQVPVVGATSFQIIAAAFESEEDAPDAYGIAAPAGLGAIFCQIFGPERAALSDLAVLRDAEAAGFFEGRAKLLVGPAAARAAGADSLMPMRFAELVPDAATLAAMAPGLDPETARPSPFYARPADARPQTAHLIPRKEG
ncbi:MAG: tRNA (adenosine(37)-N6)-threonylcarbamoyltransferase complex dimerization subunit type 1 TsaB [Rhodomicrobium sp.]